MPIHFCWINFRHSSSYAGIVRVTLRLTVSQQVSMSWCRAHFVDIWPDIASFSRVWVWNLLSCLWWEAASVCHSLVNCLCVHLPFTFLSFTHLPLYKHYTIHTRIIYTRPLLVLAQYNRLCPTTHADTRHYLVATVMQRLHHNMTQNPVECHSCVILCCAVQVNVCSVLPRKCYPTADSFFMDSIQWMVCQRDSCLDARGTRSNDQQAFVQNNAQYVSVTDGWTLRDRLEWCGLE
jgi:hypothetical protein